MTRWIAALAALLLTLSAARAQADDKPTDVSVGVYVVQLDDPSLKDSQFTTVFWVWFRWQGDKDLNPIEKFEVVGGQVEGLENEDSVYAQDAGGVHYQVAKVRATVTQDFDISRFPMDEHTLQLSIEETFEGVGKIRYVADTRNTKLQETIALAGLVIGKTEATAGTQTYTSTFGDPRVEAASGAGAEATYARFTLSIPVQRPGIGYPIKLFWSLYLSVFVAVLAFHIKPIDLDPRFGLGIGAVFAAMASAFVISSALPDGNQVTLADEVVMISIGFIVASVIQSIVSLRLYQAGKEKASSRLDLLSFVGFTAAYAAINVILLRGA
jgi:hypothetical protein